MQSQPTMMFCIGATKAGTSWLYDHLSVHPDCHLRTVKELHYFTCRTPAQFDAAVARVGQEISRIEQRAGGAPNASQSRRLADLRDWQAVLARGTQDMAAYRAYLTAGRNDQRLVGEATPAYALLDEVQLAGLSGTAEDVRIVYLMRDPVARLWSHVRMIAQRTRPAAFADEARALLGRLLSGDLSGEGKGIALRGDYAAILPKLARAFDPRRLLVMFTEDLMGLAGIARLQAFLGLRPMMADLGRRVHEGQPLAMSAEDILAARRWLRPQYEYVSRQFPALPAAWRANMEGVIA